MAVTPKHTHASFDQSTTILSRLSWARRHGSSTPAIPRHDEKSRGKHYITFYVPEFIADEARSLRQQIDGAVQQALAGGDLGGVNVMSVPNHWLIGSNWHLGEKVDVAGARIRTHVVEPGGVMGVHNDSYARHDNGLRIGSVKADHRETFRGIVEYLDPVSGKTVSHELEPIFRAPEDALRAIVNWHEQRNAALDAGTWEGAGRRAGWAYAGEDRMRTNNDPLLGGIIDKAMVDGKWFVVFHHDTLPAVEGFDSSAEAHAYFERQLAGQLANDMGDLAHEHGLNQERVISAYQQHVVRSYGGSERAQEVVMGSMESLEVLGENELLRQCLEAGVSPNDLAGAIWGVNDWNKVRASYGRSESDIRAVWEDAGYQINSTCGGCWAAMKVVGGVEFWLTDNSESSSPNPDFTVQVGAYVPDTYDSLNFSRDEASMAAADAQLAEWATELQDALHEAFGESDAPAPKPSRGPSM